MSAARRIVAGLVALSWLALGCVRAPSPFTPFWSGSVGVPHRGVLTGGVELPESGDGFRWLRHDDRHFALPRFASVIEHAARTVAQTRPGATLFVGDLSRQGGGQLLPHFSHRSGRDADLLLYVMTVDGAPIESPGFVRFDADGLAFDDKSGRYLRFDVEREWMLVKALVEDPDAKVQWIFVHHAIEAMLVEWARARGESTDTILHAELVMAQPAPPAEPHDDHLHVRTACTRDEALHGCEPNGPTREWLEEGTPLGPEPADDELVAELSRPLEPPQASTTAAPSARGN